MRFHANMIIVLALVASCSSGVLDDFGPGDGQATAEIVSDGRMEPGEPEGSGDFGGGPEDTGDIDGDPGGSGEIGGDSTPVDECDSTSECVAIHGPTATDCVNSHSDRSYCQCGAIRCGQGGDADVGGDPGSTAGVYIEVESVSPTTPWVEETATGGYSGSSYFHWPDVSSKPNGITSNQNAFMSYAFTVGVGGMYLFEVRGRRDREGWCRDAPDDACNDVWAKIDNGSWTKKMVKMGSWEKWIWDGKWEPGDHVILTEVHLGPGNHTYSLAGRSNGVKIDAIRIYLRGTSPPRP